MPELLEATLRLDTSSAQREIDRLGAEVTRSVGGAIDALPDPHLKVTADASEVTAATTGAVDAADTLAEVSGDASEVTAATTGAVESADKMAVISGDASQIPPAITGAVDGVGTVTVPFDVDTSNATRKMDEFKASAAGAPGVISQITDGLNNMGAVGTLAAAGIGTAIGYMATRGVAALGRMALSVVQQGIAFNTLQQQSQAALTAMLGSGKKALSLLTDLRDFARGTPFPLQGYIQATQQLVGFGVEASKVIPILDAVTDGVAAIGGGAQEIALITNVFSTIQAQGRITGEELMRLGAVGIDALTMLAKQAGISASEMRDQVFKGAVDAETAIAGLTKGIKDKFGGAAANVKETWIGATDRIRAAIRDVGSALVEPFIHAQGGGAAVQWANEIADVLRGDLIPAAKLVGEIFAGLANSSIPLFIGGLRGILGAIQPFLEILAEIPPEVLAVTANMLIFGKTLQLVGSETIITQGALGALGATLGLMTASLQFIPGEAQKVATSIGSMAIAGAAMSKVIPNMSAGMGIAAGATIGLGQAVGGTEGDIVSMAGTGAMVGAAFGGWGAPIGAAVGALAGLGFQFTKSGESAEQLAAKIAELSKRLKGLEPPKAAAAFFDEIGESAAEMAHNFRVASMTQEEWSDAVSRGVIRVGQGYGEAVKQVDEYRSKFGELAKQNPGQAKIVLDGLMSITGAGALTTKQVEKLQKQLASGEKDFKKAAKAEHEAALANDELTESATAGADAAAEAKKEWQSYIEGLANAGPTMGEFAAQVRDVIPAIEDFSGSFAEVVDKPVKTKAIDFQATVDSINLAATQIGSWSGLIQQLEDAGLEGLAQIARAKGPLAGAEFAYAWLTAGPKMAQAAEDAIHQAGQASIDAQIAEAYRMTQAVIDFQSNVQFLIASGNTEIARAALELGPEAGAAYAEAWANATEAQRAAMEAVLEAQKQAHTDLGDWIRGPGAEALAQAEAEAQRRAREASVPEAEQTGAQTAAAARRAYYEGLGFIVDDTGYIFDAATGAIAGYDPLIAEAAGKAGIDAERAYYQSLGFIVDETGYVFDAATGAVVGKIEGLAGAAGRAGNEARNRHKAGVDGIPGDTKGALDRAGNQVDNSPIPEKAGKKGKEAADRYGSGVSVMGPKSQEAVKAAQNIIEGARGIGEYAYLAGLYIGQRMGTGIQVGIRGRINHIANAAREVVQAAIDAANETAGNTSPSKEMMKVGRYMGQGLAIGFADAAQDMVAEAQLVVGSTIARAAGSPAPVPSPNAAPPVNVNVSLPEGAGEGRSVNIGQIVTASQDPAAVAREIEWRERFGG